MAERMMEGGAAAYSRYCQSRPISTYQYILGGYVTFCYYHRYNYNTADVNGNVQPEIVDR